MSFAFFECHIVVSQSLLVHPQHVFIVFLRTLASSLQEPMDLTRADGLLSVLKRGPLNHGDMAISVSPYRKMLVCSWTCRNPKETDFGSIDLSLYKYTVYRNYNQKNDLRCC